MRKREGTERGREKEKLKFTFFFDFLIMPKATCEIKKKVECFGDN